MANWAVELFGEELLSKGGKKATEEVVAGKKAVLVYFSAHWCPPCRGFTPVLADAYKCYSGGEIEVIFVSSDRDQGSFDGYFAEMPWTALPLEDRERKSKISEKFKVQGIPMLVVLSGEDGKMLSQNGRGEVQRTNDLGKSLGLWMGDGSTPKPSTPGAAPHWSAELFGDIIATKSGKKVTSDVIEGKKAVLVYCSAHWCPPCRGFTPLLAEAYKNYGGEDVEVIFVSSDQDQGSFDGYFAEMPWAAVPFVDRERKNQICGKFSVQGIPALIVLNGEDGRVVSQNGRGEVQSTKDLKKCLALWGLGKGGSKKSSCCVIS